MKVYGLFKQHVFMPFVHESLVDIYGDKDTVDTVCAGMNATNIDPMEEDSYGPMHGCKYFVAELEVK